MDKKAGTELRFSRGALTLLRHVAFFPEIPTTPTAGISRQPFAALSSAASTSRTAIPAPGPKFDYKLRWFERLIVHASELLSLNAPVALAGDYNVMPTDLDVYKPERWVDDALFRPEVRTLFTVSSNKAGRMPCASCIPPNASTPFGTISETRGAGMQGCVSIISCSAPLWPNAFLPPVSTGTYEAGKRRAIMRPYGSKSLTLVKTGGRPMTKPLLVIDGDSFAHRAYHAVPKTIRRAGNKGAGAIVGFANFLLRLYESERPRAVLVGWDTLDAPTYRHKALEGYQAGRRFDDDLIDQLAVLPEFVAACGFASAKAAGYEADDFLAAAAAQEEREGGTAIVATGDRDAYQLASEATTILQPVRAGEMVRIGPAEVRERYGVDPRQVPDFIALRGDASDRIPGAKGIGEKGAASILRRYGSLENAIAAGRFPAQAEKLRLYRSIATMDRSAPSAGVAGSKTHLEQGCRLSPGLAAQKARRKTCRLGGTLISRAFSNFVRFMHIICLAGKGKS